MKQWMIALVVVFGIAGGASGAKAQTADEARNLASSAENAATNLRELAESTVAGYQSLLRNDALIAIAPSEVRHVREISIASAQTLRRQARAYEMLARKLRQYAIER